MCLPFLNIMPKHRYIKPSIKPLILVYLFVCSLATVNLSFAENVEKNAQNIAEDALDANNGDTNTGDTNSGENNPAYANNLSKNQAILYHLLIADMAARRHLPEIALKNYLLVANLTKDPAIAKEATEWAIEFQSPEYAFKAAELWANTAPDDIQAQMVAATLVIGQSAHKAMPYLIRAIELEPNEIGQHIIAIQSKLSTKSAENLKVALFRIAREKSDNPYTNLVAALSAVQQEDLESANRFVDSALEIMPNLTAALELKARLIRHEDNSDSRALKFLKDKVNKFSNNAELRLFYASALLDANQLPDATYHLKQITEDKVFGGKALLFLGEIYLKEGDVKKSMLTWKKAREHSNTKDNAHFLLGQLAEQQGQTKDALLWYTSIESGTFHVIAQLRAADLLKENKEYQQAIKVLHAAKPTTLEEQKQLFLTEINILIASKQLDEAMSLAEELVSKLPEDEDLLLARSLVAAKLNQWQMAENDLKTIIKLNPNNAAAMNTLGYILSIQKERRAEAKQYLEQALSLAPNNPSYLDSLGWYYFQEEQYEKAVTYLKSAYELNRDPEIAAHLAEALWHLGRNEEAKTILSQALKQNPKNEILQETIGRLKIELKLMKIVHH